IDDHARPEVIRIVRLPCPNRSEKRAVQSLGECGVTNIVHCNVSIDTGFYVSFSIEMEITATSSNTAIHMGTIIPEVQEEHLLCLPEVHNLFTKIITLFGGNHQ